MSHDGDGGNPDHEGSPVTVPVSPVPLMLPAAKGDNDQNRTTWY